MRSKKILAVLCTASLALAAASCGNSNSTTTQAANTTAATKADASSVTESLNADAGAGAPGEEAGFTEIPIFEDHEVAFMNVSTVYFQPVPMTDGNGVEGYSFHLEADISALENNFGYGVGDWVPYLTVDYSIDKDDGSTAASGTFMVMSASDGPHYGANVKLDEAGTYTLTITIHSPADNNYLLHTDDETGPGAKSFDEAFNGGVLTTSGTWDYIPQEW